MVSYSRELGNPWAVTFDMPEEARSHERPNSGRLVRHRTLLRNFTVFCVVVIVLWKCLPSATTTSTGSPTPLKEVKTHNTLLNAIKSNQELLDDISHGKIYGVDPAAAWRKPIVFDPRYSVASTKIPPAHRRCQVSTYIDSEDERQKVNELLQVWKRAWWAFGFEPVILTRKDCESNPNYSEFNASADIEVEYKVRNRKLFAWAAHGAGLYADYTAIPATWFDSDDTLELFKSCNFAHPVKYRDTELDLFHADISYAKKIINALLKGSTDPELVDDLFYEEEQNLIAHYTPDNMEKMFDGNEKNVAETANIANAHLHHAFLSKYPKGIAILDPNGDDALNEPARRLAKRLASCPQFEDSDSCPPTQPNLKMADKLQKSHVPVRSSSERLCGNPCTSKDGISTSPIHTEVTPFLPPANSGYFSCVGIAHPLSVLTMTEGKADVNANSARKHLLRDPTVRALTSGYITSDMVGIDQRLLLVKDAMYTLPSISNSTWLIWEQEFGQDQVQEELVEWDLGFAMDEKRPSTRKNNKDSKTVSWIQQLGENAIGRVIPKKKKLKNDEDKTAIEAWNTGDSEMWKFLSGWLSQRNDELSRVVFETVNV